MIRLTVAGGDISVRLALGTETDRPPDRGIRIESLRNVAAGGEHEYLIAPSFLFEFALDDGPPRIASRDLIVTGHDVVVPERHVRVRARAREDPLVFAIDIVADGVQAVVMGVTITNEGPVDVYLRMVIPKLLGLRTRGNASDSFGMISMEIGSAVPLVPLLVENGRPDEIDGTFNPGTMGMPYRREAKRIGVPTSMNTLEVASIYDSVGGGGMFVADLDGDVDRGIAPVQLTVSLGGIEGFWVSAIPPHGEVVLPRLAVGVHNAGDWHEAVDYHRRAATGPIGPAPKPPPWFRDAAAIYSHSGGGAGGIYLANDIENLPDGAVATTFEVGGAWPPAGPIPFTQAGLAPPGAPMAVVTRDFRDQDLFIVDNEGAIAWSSMREGGSWSSPAQRITSPGFAMPNGGIAAVARNSTQIDVFVLRVSDGAVWSVFGPGIDVSSWRAARLSEAWVAPPGASIAAITRDGRDVDVFVIGALGAIRWLYERNNAAWQAPSQPITEDATAPHGGHLAALARNAEQTDVFFVDAGGLITTVYKTSSADDAPWWSATLSRRVAPAGAGIAASVREAKDEDVFVVGTGGAIIHSTMRDNGGWSESTTIAVSREGGTVQRDGFAPAGAPLAVVARTGRTDLFFGDHSGAVVLLSANSAGEWTAGDALTLGSFSTPGATTTAVMRNDLQEDVFVVMKGRIRSFADLPLLLEEARSVGTDIVYLWDYWEGRPSVQADVDGHGPLVPLHPPYFNKGDYVPRADLGGEDALRRGIARIHELGGKVILYLEPFIIFKDSYVARFRPRSGFKSQGEYLGGRYPTKAPLEVIARAERGAEWPIYDFTHTMVPAFARWRSHVLKVVGRLIDYGADGILLDSFGWQMNWPMHVDYSGPQGNEQLDLTSLDYTRGVLELADAVREIVGSDRIVLVETPSGPMGRHCHGGLSADFAFHIRDGLSNQSRITASPVRYARPEVRYFSNGGDSLNRLHQIYAAGHGLALCHQHVIAGQAGHLKRLVDIRRDHAETLIHGDQHYQPQADAGRGDVAAYAFRSTGGSAIITAVNTSESTDYRGALRLRAEHFDSAWTDLISGRSITAKGPVLEVVLPRGGAATPDNLIVLLRK